MKQTRINAKAELAYQKLLLRKIANSEKAIAKLRREIAQMKESTINP